MGISDPIPGYMGVLSADGTKIRVTSFSVNPEQTISFYDHTIGLRDNIPGSIFGPKGDAGFNSNPQKNLFRPSVITVGGSFSYPLFENGGNTLFTLAKEGRSFPITFTRDCYHATTYSDCKISQYQLSMAAGDVPNITCTIAGISATEGSAGALGEPEIQKLVTWDACSVSVPGIDADRISSFDMTITNDCKYVYTAGNNASNGLKAKEIRVGLQSVTGTISYYAKGRSLEFLNGGSPSYTINVSADDLVFDIKCVFQPVKREGVVGPVISTLSFVGVGDFWTEE